MKQLPPLSPQYNCVAMPSCRRLPVHWTRQADALALARADSSMAARIAMIAMTTSSSINVKARCFMVFQRVRLQLPSPNTHDTGNPRRAQLTAGAAENPRTSSRPFCTRTLGYIRDKFWFALLMVDDGEVARHERN